MFGYSGNILYVDLTTKKTRTASLTDEFCKKYIGGTGFLTRLLYDNTEPEVNPLSPSNPLVFATGSYAQTPIPTGSRFVVGAKSPLTGFIGDCTSSSIWGPELKRTGHDALVIKGRADRPTYLFVDDDTVYFKDAKDIWGKSFVETEGMIREEIGDKFVSVSGIGLAGERLVRFACIMNDYGENAGRTGLGAVMGSKNLKAIALRGSGATKVAKLEELSKFCLDLNEKCQGMATEKYRILGTPANVLVLNRLASLPSRNWQQANFENAEKVSGECMQQNYVTNTYACESCPIACKHVCVVKEGPLTGAGNISMDYETLYALGPQCGIDDFPTIIKANELCDYYGMDTISTGVTIGWAMECYERGILTDLNTEGLEIRFGNSDALLKLISKIALRSGLGNLLADGTKEAAEKIGSGSKHFAMHIKGLELPGYDIRGLKTAALGLAVAARGGCHNRSGAYDYDLSGKVDRLKAEASRGVLAAASEDFATIMDSLCICKFSRRIYQDFYNESAELYSLVTGIKVTAGNLKETAERIINMKKAYNIREGWTSKDDNLPPRIMRDPIPSGAAKGSMITPEEFNLMLDGYYQARGWTKEGSLPKKKLIELGLSDIADEVGV